MGMTVVTVLTCDRCGASTQGEPPRGSSKISVEWLNKERGPITGWYCPSCTEAIIGFATTPPS